MQLSRILTMSLKLTAPELYLIIKKTKKSEPKPTQSWQVLRSILLPAKIDNVYITKGSLHYLDQIAEAPFDMEISEIEAKLTGLQTQPTCDNQLPSVLNLTAETIGQGQATVRLAFNSHAVLPAFKIEGKIENMRLNEINGFLKNYTSLRIKQGEFNFYMEAAAKDGYIKGYAKPMFKNLKVTLPPEAQRNILKRMYRAVVQWLADLLKNNLTKNVATQISLSGKIDNADESGLWSAISTLLRNAFLEALLPGIDSSIKYP